MREEYKLSSGKYDDKWLVSELIMKFPASSKGWWPATRQVGGITSDHFNNDPCLPRNLLWRGALKSYAIRIEPQAFAMAAQTFSIPRLTRRDISLASALSHDLCVEIGVGGRENMVGVDSMPGKGLPILNQFVHGNILTPSSWWCNLRKLADMSWRGRLWNDLGCWHGCYWHECCWHGRFLHGSGEGTASRRLWCIFKMAALKLLA